jgi:hypothetical protein
LVLEAIREIEAGRRLAPVVDTPQAGDYNVTSTST